ncbi:hypothetical protein [Nonomuraea solani]|nr:hypothetical protein [Nonomuraea solani]
MTVIPDSPTAWARVRDLVTARRAGDLADHVLGLNGDERAEAALGSRVAAVFGEGAAPSNGPRRR